MLIIKKFFILLGLQAICSAGSMLFLMMFPGIIDFMIGKILFSLLAIITFFDLFFTLAWNMANRELKMIKIHNNHLNDGESPLKLTYSKGIVLSLAYGVLGVILCAISFALSEKTASVSVFLFRVWYSEFVAVFMHSVSHIKHVSYAVSVFPAIAIVLGYFCGAKNYNFTEEVINKLVYKTNKDKKQNKSSN